MASDLHAPRVRVSLGREGGSPFSFTQQEPRAGFELRPRNAWLS